MPPEFASILVRDIVENRRVSATWVLDMATWVHSEPTLASLSFEHAGQRSRLTARSEFPATCSRRPGHRCWTVSPVIRLGMAEVTVRELRNDGGRVLDRVARGESLTVTRDGHAIAELRPLARRPLRASALLNRWRRLRHVDAARLRADIDAALDTSL